MTYPLYRSSPVLFCGSTSHIRFFDANQEVVRATSKNILVDRTQGLLSCLGISLASSSLDSGGNYLYHPAGRFRTILIEAGFEHHLFVENLILKAG
jgi:hypothetical protein